MEYESRKASSDVLKPRNIYTAYWGRAESLALTNCAMLRCDFWRCGGMILRHVTHTGLEQETGLKLYLACIHGIVTYLAGCSKEPDSSGNAPCEAMPHVPTPRIKWKVLKEELQNRVCRRGSSSGKKYSLPCAEYCLMLPVDLTPECLVGFN